MPTAAILPVKRFTLAKSRLEPGLGQGARRALAAAMFEDVLGALLRSTLLDRIIIVSGEPSVRDAAADPKLMFVQDLTEKGQSSAALAGLARAATLGHERVLLVPGDTPLVDPLELDNLIANATLAELELVIVPDRHGSGTNALLVDPTASFHPQFGPGSRERHEEQARRRDFRYEVEEVPSLLLDIDTPDDLAELRRAFDEGRGRAPRTQGALMQIERSRSSAIPA
jgi:2-phospho-L-lactate guanylyltransferase